ncbi:unnamed protein product [Fraxinus pennsylvanica]|uniref:Uncharacterized protein n=1 Tax=Fraxinus pennsylvanica TaxID=56036 RepID=A0AAD2E488_9LAMI|nr:unnamed protein product [Fraxinus pennsylvanica]
MEEMVSLWNYQENIDELNQKLMYAILELEKSKVEANEKTRKNKERVKQLIQLLNITIQERDEARNQLQTLLKKSMLTSSTESLNILPQFHVNNPLVKPRKTNSCITESNSLSSLVDSLFDAVSSPELSNSIMISTNQVPTGIPNIDHASLIIDNLVTGRVLPQTGKFLQAVVEARPLLQTLLVAGPLPRWQNPPRVQPFHIPPSPIKGYDHEMFAQEPASNLGQLVSRSLDSQPCAQMSCESSQILPTLIFGNVPRESSLHNGIMMSTTTDVNSCIPLAKRRNFY